MSSEGRKSNDRQLDESPRVVRPSGEPRLVPRSHRQPPGQAVRFSYKKELLASLAFSQ